MYACIFSFFLCDMSIIDLELIAFNVPCPWVEYRSDLLTHDARTRVQNGCNSCKYMYKMSGAHNHAVMVKIWR